MIKVYGLIGQPSPALLSDVAQAKWVVGGRRHLDALQVAPEKRIVLGKVADALEQLHQMADSDLAVVAASGDPLFHGIGRQIRESGLQAQFIPAPTSIAWAFARIGIPWDDAVLVSAHLGELDAALTQIGKAKKAAVLTAPTKGIHEISRAFPERTFVLAQCLGQADEEILWLDGQQAQVVTVKEPNVVLVFQPSVLDSWTDLNCSATGASSSHSGISASPVLDGENPTQPVIGQIVNSPASIRHAKAIETALGQPTKHYVGNAKQSLSQAWKECDLIISHLALGATTRLLAPMLESKLTDPGVVVVDEAGRFAIPLVGGHVGGANHLAKQVSEALHGTAVLTTATDALNLPALDQLGLPYSGAIAQVTQAIINQQAVLIERSQPWPLPPLPENVSLSAQHPAAKIVFTDLVQTKTPELPTVVVHPKSLIVGMGCNQGTRVEALQDLLTQTLDQAGLALESVAAITTHEVKAGELGLIKLAHRLKVPLITYPADVLETQPAPNPSAVVAQHVQTASVSEASVLAHKATLIVPKQKTLEATCAVGRMPARGKLQVVGLGPGARDLLTPRAVNAIKNATLIEGYGPYVNQIKDLARPGAKVKVSKMGTESERTARAIQAARDGQNVVLVCSGDPSMYAMASPVLEQGTDGIDLEIVPGITASLAASSILGAPLGHDNCTISLSDLHTSWDVIEKRLQAAAEGDFVVALYNPRSRTRRKHLPRALEILSAHRPPSCPVAVVRQATRAQESYRMSTLADFNVEWVDMNSIVIVGSSNSKFVTTGSGESRIVTPRDYHWMGENK